MAEYIEREAAIDAIVSEPPDAHYPQWYADKIKAIPAADVAPVVHGKWVFADDGYLRCSECTQKAPVVQPYDDEPTTTATNYCPYCGARMDKED